MIVNQESRVKNIDTEWELANYAFDEAVKRFGLPEIDLFASRNNTKCEKFFAWGKDPEALAVDAFTQNCHSLGLFWAFPPFALILRVLKKIIVDRATGIVVVPHWTSQPCFLMFTELLIEELMFFNPSTSLLLSPCRSKHHPLANKLSLIVGKLSGNPSGREVCRIYPGTYLKHR